MGSRRLSPRKGVRIVTGGVTHSQSMPGRAVEGSAVQWVRPPQPVSCGLCHTASWPVGASVARPRDVKGPGALRGPGFPGDPAPSPPTIPCSLQEGLSGAVWATDSGTHHTGRRGHLHHRVLAHRAPGEWRGGPGKGSAVWGWRRERWAQEGQRRAGAGGWGHTGLTAYRPQIVVSLVNGRPGAMNFSYSPLLREFTKATNIRLRFLRTNTLLGHLMGKALRDPTVTRRVSCPWPRQGRGSGWVDLGLGVGEAWLPGAHRACGCSIITASRTSASEAAVSATATRMPVMPKTPQTRSGEAPFRGGPIQGRPRSGAVLSSLPVLVTPA